MPVADRADAGVLVAEVDVGQVLAEPERHAGLVVQGQIEVEGLAEAYWRHHPHGVTGRQAVEQVLAVADADVGYRHLRRDHLAAEQQLDGHAVDAALARLALVAIGVFLHPVADRTGTAIAEVDVDAVFGDPRRLGTELNLHGGRSPRCRRPRWS